MDLFQDVVHSCGAFSGKLARISLSNTTSIHPRVPRLARVFRCVGLRIGAKAIPKLRCGYTLTTHILFNIYCYVID
jgi:hypothetical protein